MKKQFEFKVGDILLFHYKIPKFIGYAIQVVTRNPFAHSAVYIGDGKMVESKGRKGGVIISDVPKKSYLTTYRVFRPKKPLNEEEQRYLINRANVYVGTPYDYQMVTVYFFLYLLRYCFNIEFNLIRSVPLIKRTTAKFFCHELTGTLYGDIKRPIKEDIHPSNIMAEDIVNNPNFIEVF